MPAGRQRHGAIEPLARTIGDRTPSTWAVHEGSYGIAQDEHRGARPTLQSRRGCRRPRRSARRTARGVSWPRTWPASPAAWRHCRAAQSKSASRCHRSPPDRARSRPPARRQHARGAQVAVEHAHVPVGHFRDNAVLAGFGDREHAAADAGPPQERGALLDAGLFEAADRRLVFRGPEIRQIVGERFAHAPSGWRHRQVRVQLHPSFDGGALGGNLPGRRRVAIVDVHEPAHASADVERCGPADADVLRPGARAWRARSSG